MTPGWVTRGKRVRPLLCLLVSQLRPLAIRALKRVTVDEALTV